MPDLSKLLAEAYRTRTPFAYSPDMGPETLAQAYDIQLAVAQSMNATAVGWKSGVQDGGKTLFGAPILSPNLRADGGSWSIPAGQSIKIEVEIALRLGKDLPPRSGKPYTREDILDTTEEVFAGIEIVGSRYSNLNEVQFLPRVADNFNQAGYVIGGGTKSFRSLDLSKLRSQLWIDGALAHDKVGGHGHGDPLIPVVAWASGQADRLGGLRAGQFITTGTLNKPPSYGKAGRAEIEIEGLGRASVEFTQ